MATVNLGEIDANIHRSQLLAFKGVVELWHGDLRKHANEVEAAIEQALAVCRPGVDQTNALNNAGLHLRTATETLAKDAMALLTYEATPAQTANQTLGALITTVGEAVKWYNNQHPVSARVYAGHDNRGEAFVKTLRQINDKIGATHDSSTPVPAPGDPVVIKPILFPAFLAALSEFQLALKNLYASRETLTEPQLKDSGGRPHESIYDQDVAKKLRDRAAKLLKQMLDRDHAAVLGTAHVLDAHGYLNPPAHSHDTFAARLFNPTPVNVSIGFPIKLEDALKSEAPTILIQGDGGCGKTVALWRFGFRINTDGQREDIALYIKLHSSFPFAEERQNIETAGRLASDSCRGYVLLDGLDEVRLKRSDIVTAIAGLIEANPSLFWRISTRDLREELPEETKAWHLFKINPFAVDSIVPGIQNLSQIAPAARDHAVTLIKSDKQLASLLGNAFYYGLFCRRLVSGSGEGTGTFGDESNKVFRSDLLTFGLYNYIKREMERRSLTATQQVISGWIVAWENAMFNELQMVANNTALVNHQIASPKHDIFRDWLLASYLAEAKPQDVQVALTKMPGPRRRSVMSLMLEKTAPCPKTNEDGTNRDDVSN